MAKKPTTSRFPWYTSSFDLEGVGFGLLALVVAILLGTWVTLLGILFLIPVAVIILASRDATRTPPAISEAVLSPVDGVIVDISTVSTPRDLRWDEPDTKRIRIASSPFSINGVRAPMTGTVESFLIEPGAPAALSQDPDSADLREAFLLVSSEHGLVGTRIATGGLGPRLDIDLENGDGVRAGRKVGVRRLGGWCDVYVPQNVAINWETGMSVIGGETVLAKLTDVSDEGLVEKAPAAVEENVPDSTSEAVVAAEPAMPEKTAKVTDATVAEVATEEVKAEEPKSEPSEAAASVPKTTAKKAKPTDA